MQSIIKIKFYVEIDDKTTAQHIEQTRTTLGGCIKLSKSVTRMNFYGYYCHYVKLPGISWCCCCAVFELDVEPKNLSGAGIRKFSNRKRVLFCPLLLCFAINETLVNKFLRLLLCKHKNKEKSGFFKFIIFE